MKKLVVVVLVVIRPLHGKVLDRAEAGPKMQRVGPENGWIGPGRLLSAISRPSYTYVTNSQCTSPWKFREFCNF